MRALALIDYAEHSRGGHFGPYLVWFAREFARRFDTVLVFTPHPASTANLFRLSPEQMPQNISCHPLPPGPRKKWYRLKRRPCPLAKIFSVAAARAPGHTLSGFVMWAYDLVLGNVAEGPSGAPWATLGGISYLQRGHPGRVAESERRVLNLCENHRDCVSFLIWDPYVISPAMTKLQWLPGNETAQLPASSTITTTIRQHAGGRFCLGAFGYVTGPRCLNELLPLVKKNPEISFVLVGVIADQTAREDLRPLLGAEKPDNLLLIRGFQLDLQLNAAMAAADAMLIDGVHYPVHSTMVSKAMLLKKWVLTPESNSWTADFIRQYEAGLVYSNLNLNLQEAWNQWKENGGPERGYKAMASVLSQPELARCFEILDQRFQATPS